MKAMTITLSDGLEDWIGQRLEDGSYATASAYVTDLVRRDRERAEEVQRIKALVEEGLASGVIEMDASEVLDSIIAEDSQLNA
ncbi:type II toxin-antitoxin system ParD family antitoxin [Novosphingopyxis sp.]|uniref:type II toxin-antitoxin system ParD family antitoxin n=1 Tax=Novosphingopyxis sp. TaxID=2709690 RepID=UPI003B59FD26